MPVLKTARDQFLAINSWTTTEVRRSSKVLRELLATSPSVLTRIAAADALARSAVPVRDLPTILAREKNDLVLDSLCQLAEALNSAPCIPALRLVASRGISGLSRSAAFAALWHIQGPKSFPFMIECRERERSRRATAVMDVILLKAGVHQALERVIRSIASKDYLVRCRVANTLAVERPLLERKKLVVALAAAEETEPTVAALEPLQAALRALKASPRRSR